MQATLNSMISGWETFQIKQKQERKKNKSSSNITEVIRTVSKFLLFFQEKISHAQKSIKSTKKAPKAQKGSKSTKTQPNKSTKRN